MSTKLIIIFTFLFSGFILADEAQNSISIIILDNGDSISGEILDSNDDIIIIKTNYGDMEIKKSMIVRIDNVDSSIKDKIQFKKNRVQLNSDPKINQEARWRTIYLGMTTANTLYGIGIPYVFGLYENSENIAAGFQLLMFGGSFYAVYKYTDGMDLPYGRSSFQYTGAALGGYSILPIMAVVGFDNWFDFDEEGKITWLYEMVAVPYGVILADRLYNKWNLTNGQARIVSAAVPLGTFNSFMFLTTLYEDGWEDENIVRLYIPLIYGGSLAHGYWAKNYVDNKDYSEDDALFLTISGGLGAYNALSLLNILESDNNHVNRLIITAGVNGFAYLGDRINKEFKLEKGETSIIGLGMGASSLVFMGVATIFDIEDDKIWSAGLMTSMTAGWYFTYKTVTKNSKGSYSSNNKFNKFLEKVSISPTFQIQNKNIVPAIHFQMNF